MPAISGSTVAVGVGVSGICVGVLEGTVVGPMGWKGVSVAIASGAAVTLICETAFGDGDGTGSA